MSLIKLIALSMLVVLMLESGMMVKRGHIVAALKDYPLLARAILADFILVPLCGAILVRVFHLSDFIAVGVLLMAIAPGVPFLARAAGTKSGGSLGFALALSFVMPALSILTVPLTAHWILPVQAQARVPIASTILTLVVFQLAPLLVGMWISERFPQTAERLLRPLSAIVGVLLIAVLVILAPALMKSIATVYGSNGTITAFFLVLLSLGIGWLLGGPSVAHRNTLSIGSALRNVGLALAIATVDFAGTPAAAMVMSYFLVQIVAGLIAGRIFARQKPALAT